MDMNEAVDDTPGTSGNISRVQLWIRVGVLGLLAAAFLLSGVQNQITVERLRAIGANPLTAALIVVIMTVAWAFALPGSAFFFVTPFLYPPVISAAILTIGSATGTTAGYLAARFVGGPWVEPYRQSRVTKFLHRHSSFGMLFAIRVFPGAQHGIINYSGGILKLPFWKFLSATLLAIAIKAFLYSTALQGSVGALSVRDALTLPTVAALSAFAGIGVGGHLLKRKWEAEDAKRESAGEPD